MKLHHLKEPATKGSENPSPILLGEGFIDWGYTVVEKNQTLDNRVLRSSTSC